MAGKGSKPRNCFSKQYRDNYDSIFRKNGHQFPCVPNPPSELTTEMIENHKDNVLDLIRAKGPLEPPRGQNEHLTMLNDA